CRFVGVAIRHRNEGALRMIVGMRLRGAMLGALIMLAVPVAASLASMLASSPATAQTVQSIEVVGNRRVELETIRSYFKPGPGGVLDQGRIDDGLKALIETGLFQDVRISREGAKTGIKSIEFVGNVAYSSYRLRDIIKTRESNLLSFLGGADVYDPDRVEADRDLIRRFYLKHGYADVQVVAALTEYDPERKGFLVTFKIEEGQQYRVGSVAFNSSIATLDGNTLSSFSHVYVGSVYNAEALEKSFEEMQIEASRRGYAFAIVHPRGDRNFDAHTVS